MDHLQSFQPRRVMTLPVVEQSGWTLKRYAILAEGRAFDVGIVAAASAEAFKRLPKAGTLVDSLGNHGVGLQLVHFAETAVVSPIFYWQWGSVLANLHQIRAPWDRPMDFRDGVGEVIGCVWEMDVVTFEVEAWKSTLLADDKPVSERVADYLDRRFVSG